jgi:hypothetical protein
MERDAGMTISSFELTTKPCRKYRNPQDELVSERDLKRLGFSGLDIHRIAYGPASMTFSTLNGLRWFDRNDVERWARRNSLAGAA